MGTFAAGWAITFARVAELGLNRRAATDWTGGFATWLDQIYASDEGGVIDGYGLPASTITGQYDTEANARSWLVTDGDGLLLGQVADTISAGDKDVIDGTGSADHIRITGDTLDAADNNGGSGINTGLTVNGATAMKMAA